MAIADSDQDLSTDLERRLFERRFREHYAEVLAFALRRVPGRAAAEDVAAETFAVLWRRRHGAPRPVLPWLYGVALRVIANQRRSGRRQEALRERVEAEWGTDAAVFSGAAPPDPAAALDRRDAFATAFAQLDEGEREVLRLVAWDGLDAAAAAAVLGCSAGAFRVRLHRARRKLAKHLAAAGHSVNERAAAPALSPKQETER